MRRRDGDANVFDELRGGARARRRGVTVSNLSHDDHDGIRRGIVGDECGDAARAETTGARVRDDAFDVLRRDVAPADDDEIFRATDQEEFAFAEETLVARSKIRPGSSARRGLAWTPTGDARDATALARVVGELRAESVLAFAFVFVFSVVAGVRTLVSERDGIAPYPHLADEPVGHRAPRLTVHHHERHLVARRAAARDAKRVRIVLVARLDCDSFAFERLFANRRVPRAAVARVHDALRQTVPRDERARTKPVRFERAREDG